MGVLPIKNNVDENSFPTDAEYSTSDDSSNESPKTAGRVPPHSVDAERSVLGAIMLDNEVINQVLDIIVPSDFYVGFNSIVFQAMVDLFESSSPTDIITIEQALRAREEFEKVGGIEYISNLIDSVPTSANAAYYAKIIKDCSLRRQLIHEASTIVEEAFGTQGDIDTFVDSVERRILQVADAKAKKGFTPVGDLAMESIKRLEKLCVNKEPITGTPSGFTDLDKFTSGFQESDLIIIAGRPAMGKTSLALSMAQNVALRTNGCVALFSLEMSSQQIVTRILCSEAHVNSAKARNGQFDDNDFPRLVDVASKVAQTNLYIDDTPAISALELRAKARRLHRETPLDLVIVDYLQLMRLVGKRVDRREQEISEISGALKALAKELHVPVIALSQLNRGVESRVDKRPMMSDLRESGAIEQDADLIGFVYRDEVYNPETPDKGTAEFIISKHRNGAVGTVRLAFQAEYTRFENFDEKGYDDDYLGGDIDLSGSSNQGSAPMGVEPSMLTGAYDDDDPL